LVRQRLLPLLEGAGEVALALGHEGRPAIVLRSLQPQPPALYAACAALADAGQVAGVAVWVAGTTLPAQFGAAVEWSLGGDDQPLQGTLGGFSQVHAEVNRALVARVAQLAQSEGQRVLELHAGHGNFSVVLARGARGYTAVEQSGDAVQALRDNLQRRGLPARVLEGDALAKVGKGALDVALLDPPRAGAPGVLAALARRKPARVIYVSCDPATLARDLRELEPFGYRLASAEVFDMFPQTADLESVVSMERA
jgi:23S rRNA (uracil1939-C5)-methyltransferase